MSTPKTTDLNIDEVKTYLKTKLRFLHQMIEGELDMMDVAVHEGGIMMIEEMFHDLLAMNAPSKDELMKEYRKKN